MTALPAGQVAHLGAYVDLTLLLPPSTSVNGFKSTLLDERLSIAEFDTLSLADFGGPRRERPEITTVHTTFTANALRTKLEKLGDSALALSGAQPAKIQQQGALDEAFAHLNKPKFTPHAKRRRVVKTTKNFASGFVGNAGLGQRLTYDPIGLTAVGDVCRIPDCDVVSYDWTRNPLSEPDTLDLTLSADAVPGDLRVLRGIQVDAWLFTHRDPTRLKRGQPGYFGGIVVEVGRNRQAHEVTLSCVDYTWMLGSVKVSPEVAAGISLDVSLVDVVRQLVHTVPGADSWEVVDRSQDLVATDGQLPSGPLSRVIGAKTLGHLLGKDAGISHWDAIMRVCALAGAVPEFSHAGGGNPAVSLLSPSQAQGQSVEGYRERAGRGIRTMTIGLDVSEPVETLTLDSGPRVDAVEIRCQDPDTGEVYKGVAGREGRQAITSDRIETHVAYGLTSSAECERYAAQLWRSLWQGEFGLTVSTHAPWTTGGGPDGGRPVSDATQERAAQENRTIAGEPIFGASDLLSARAGEPVIIDFDGYETAASRYGTPAQALEAQFKGLGISPDDAQRLAEAHDSLALGTLFQIYTVTHSYSDAAYTCTLDLHAFLDAPENELVIFDDPLDLPSAGLGGP